jgi:hypothetical protein
MAIERLETGLDMVRRRKLADLAYREGATDTEMLRRLIDRAYTEDLQAHLDTAEKPNSPAPPPG